MALDCKYKFYANFEELKEDKPKLAAMLLREYGEGGWMDEDLYVYPTIQDFAKFEFLAGMYAGVFGQMDSVMTDLDLPNFLDYVDFKKLGVALLDRDIDEHVFRTKSGILVQTYVGF